MMYKLEFVSSVNKVSGLTQLTEQEYCRIYDEAAEALIKFSTQCTDGSEIYPHREDLHGLPFWKCDTCDGKVGCHHLTEERTKPLGVIPSPEISKLRSEIHRLLDPLWIERGIKRKDIYADLSKLLGIAYHTAALRTPEQCKKVLDYLYATYYPHWNLK